MCLVGCQVETEFVHFNNDIILLKLKVASDKHESFKVFVCQSASFWPEHFSSDTKKSFNWNKDPRIDK